MSSKAETILDRHTKDKVGRGRFPKKGVLMAAKELASLAFESGIERGIEICRVIKEPGFIATSLTKEDFISKLFYNGQNTE